MQTQISENAEFTVLAFSEFRNSLQSHIPEIHGLTVFTFSGFRISLQSHTSEIPVFAVSSFSEFLISAKSHIPQKSRITFFLICSSFSFLRNLALLNFMDS